MCNTTSSNTRQASLQCQNRRVVLFSTTQHLYANTPESLLKPYESLGISKTETAQNYELDWYARGLLLRAVALVELALKVRLQENRTPRHLQACTFGSLNRILRFEIPRRTQKQIASSFNLPLPLFMSAIQSCVYLRNMCAHHERLWNRTMVKIPKLHTLEPFKKTHVSIPSSRRSSQTINLIAFMILSIDPDNFWPIEFGDFLSTLNPCEAAAYGYVVNYDCQ